MTQYYSLLQPQRQYTDDNFDGSWKTVKWHNMKWYEDEFAEKCVIYQGVRDTIRRVELYGPQVEDIDGQQIRLQTGSSKKDVLEGRLSAYHNTCAYRPNLWGVIRDLNEPEDIVA